MDRLWYFIIHFCWFLQLNIHNRLSSIQGYWWQYVHLQINFTVQNTPQHWWNAIYYLFSWWKVEIPFNAEEIWNIKRFVSITQVTYHKVIHLDFICRWNKGRNPIIDQTIKDGICFAVMILHICLSSEEFFEIAKN